MADPPELIFYAETPEQAMEAAVIAVLEAESIFGEWADTREPRLWKGFTPERESYFIAHLERLIESARSWEWETGESSPLETIGPHVKFTTVQPRITGWSTVRPDSD